MTCYLTIMVTVLVVTQIIRVTQNTLQLRRMSDRFNKHSDGNVIAMWGKLVESVEILSEIVKENK